jgi:PAS domain S-box-containing protein
MISRYKSKEAALLKEQERLLSILENTPCGIGINRRIFGKILYQNPEFVRMFGYTTDDIPTVRDWVPKAYPNKAYRQQVTRTWVETLEGIKGSNVLSVTCKDGSVKEIELITKVLPDRTAVNMFLDVTRREKAEAALRESETKFRLLFERSIDAIFLLDGNRFIDCNDAAVSILRAPSNKEVLEWDPLELSPELQPDGEQSSVKGQEMVNLALRDGVSRFEWVHKRFDGTLFPVEVVLTLIPLKGKEILYTSWRDITKRREAEAKIELAREELEQRVQERTAELIQMNLQLSREIETRKKIEEELQESRENLRKLSEYLQTAREEDRTRIAQEIHDELGMGLSTMKMDLIWMANRIPREFQDLIGETNGITERIDGAIQNVRRICSDLRPTILDHFGLGAAIEWQAGEFQKRTGITCTCTVDPKAAVTQGDLVSALFRILQEALTNILRYAHATSANISLRCREGRISLTVKDNGWGIRPEEVMKPNSFGLMGIRERVRFWGGDMFIKGVPGKGTLLTVTIPHSAADK